MKGGHASAALERVRLSVVPPKDLTPAQVSTIRALFWAAFGDKPDEAMTEDDWRHALSGTHFLLELDAEIVTYASVAERKLEVGSRQLRTGYVEAVAVAVQVSSEADGAAGSRLKRSRECGRYLGERACARPAASAQMHGRQ
jgi:aminoglycoside 2'-N-acetyltransferase I